MYKGAQNSQDWNKRTGSHATRFVMSQYDTETAEVYQYHVPYSDPHRMRLVEMKEERETLLGKLRLCRSAQSRAKHEGLEDDARRLGKIYMALCNRIGVINSAITNENVRVTDFRDRKAILQALRELLPESQVQEIWARKIEIENEIISEVGLQDAQ